jgi:hypothetical protein
MTHATNSSRKKIKSLGNIQKKKLYRIIWRDAFSEEPWAEEETLEPIDYLCETIGFLIENNSRPHYYTIASTISHDGYFCSIMNIPKSMVVSKTQIAIRD